MTNIRHTLNEYLYNFGGYIGYSVRKVERRKGYAKEMLKIALEECTILERIMNIFESDLVLNPVK